MCVYFSQIWDRMFGTFVEEKEDEELVFGVIPPIKTFEPVRAESHFYRELLALIRKAPLLQGFKYLCLGPGWRYSPKKQQWINLPIPPLGSKYNPPKTPAPLLPRRIILFTLLQFLTVIVAFFAIDLAKDVFPGTTSLALASSYLVATLWCIGSILDMRPFAWLAEVCRGSVLASLAIGVLAGQQARPGMSAEDLLFSTLPSLTTLSLPACIFWYGLLSAAASILLVRPAMEKAVALMAEREKAAEAAGGAGGAGGGKAAVVPATPAEAKKTN